MPRGELSIARETMNFFVSKPTFPPRESCEPETLSPLNPQLAPRRHPTHIGQIRYQLSREAIMDVSRQMVSCINKGLASSRDFDAGTKRNLRAFTAPPSAQKTAIAVASRGRLTVTVSQLKLPSMDSNLLARVQSNVISSFA